MTCRPHRFPDECALLRSDEYEDLFVIDASPEFDSGTGGAGDPDRDGCGGAGKGLDNYVDINIIKTCQSMKRHPSPTR